MNYALELVEGSYAVCRLAANEPIPGWAVREDAPLLSITRSVEELSIICAERLVPERVERSGDWIAVRVVGTLDHGLTGVLVSIAGPLADAEIPIMAVSSFDTDYILIPAARRAAAREALVAAGHDFGTVLDNRCMRLVKYLAHSGVASRRGSEKLIAAGRVAIGGETVSDPARDVDQASGVTVDGKPVAPEAREVWALNKPTGVVSTAKEPGKRRSVVELIETDRRLYPVGRLDADSSGLILIANDGELANRLTHPSYEVPKTYVVELQRAPSDVQLRKLRQGPRLEDGPTQPTRVRRAGERGIELTITEGRNRQVRRMVEAVGNRVISLRRIAFGSIELGELGEGKSRRLSRVELSRLWKDGGAMDGQPTEKARTGGGGR